MPVACKPKVLSVLLAAALVIAPGCVSHDIAKADNRTHTEHHVSRIGDRDNNDDDDDAGAIATIAAGALAVGVLLATPITELGQAIARANGDTPLKAARELNNPDFPEARRQGLVDLATRYDFARRPPYTTRYAEIARTDPDYLVRAMAIRALNISRDARSTPLFIAALEDDNEPIRLEAVKALNNIPDRQAVPGLLRRLEGRREEIVDGRPQESEEDPDVRIAAAEALRQYHTLDVATALVGYLNERNFAIAWQSHRSLERLTGRDWDYDEAAWLRYLAGPEKPSGM